MVVCMKWLLHALRWCAAFVTGLAIATWSVLCLMSWAVDPSDLENVNNPITGMISGLGELIQLAVLMALSGLLILLLPDDEPSSNHEPFPAVYVEEIPKEELWWNPSDES